MKTFSMVCLGHGGNQLFIAQASSHRPPAAQSSTGSSNTPIRDLIFFLLVQNFPKPINNNTSDKSNELEELFFYAES